MFDFIKKMFGEGKARAEFILADGRSGTATIPYIGEYDEAELSRKVTSQLYVEHGSRCTSFKVVAHTEN